MLVVDGYSERLNVNVNNTHRCKKTKTKSETVDRTAAQIPGFTEPDGGGGGRRRNILGTRANQKLERKYCKKINVFSFVLLQT